MNQELFLLGFLSITLSVSIIAYNIFRARMQRKSFFKDKRLNYYTRNRILTISFFLFFATFIFTFFAFTLFYAIKNRRGFILNIENDLPYLVSIFFFSLLAGFATGCHTAAIITEKYIKSFGSFSHKDKNFKAIYLYNEFFHGPMGHVMGYSSFMVIMFVLAVLEKDYPLFNLNQTDIIFYSFYGILLGFIFLYLQFKGFIWKHQIPWFGGIFLLHLSFIYFYKINFNNYPFNSFFFVLQTIVNFGLLIKFIFYRRRRLYYPYNLKVLFDQLLKNPS